LKTGVFSLLEGQIGAAEGADDKTEMPLFKQESGKINPGMFYIQISFIHILHIF